MLVDDAGAVDVGELVAQGGNLVGIGLDGHRTHVVEGLLNDLQIALFHDFHHVVHAQIGESERQACLLVALEDFARFDGEFGSLAVGDNQSRCAQLDAAEVADDDNDDVGQFKGVDLARCRCSGTRCARCLSCRPSSSGARHGTRWHSA